VARRRNFSKNRNDCVVRCWSGPRKPSERPENSDNGRKKEKNKENGVPFLMDRRTGGETVYRRSVDQRGFAAVPVLLVLVGLGVVAGAFLAGRMTAPPAGGAGSASRETGRGGFLADMKVATQKTVDGLLGTQEQQPVLEVDLRNRQAAPAAPAATEKAPTKAAGKAKTALKQIAAPKVEPESAPQAAAVSAPVAAPAVNNSGTGTTTVATPPASTTSASKATGVPVLHLLGISKLGDGDGIVTSEPAGISCGIDCREEYAAGTSATLVATATPGSRFDGWSGACTGKALCAVTVTAATSVAATFYLINPPVNAAPVVAPPANGVNHIVISHVQITGGAGVSDHDYIKLFNPTGAAIDLGGWKLRKRTKTGGEESIRVFPNGSIVVASGYSTWANSADGFAAGLGADVMSTQTLAANNSVAIENADGTVVDAVAWGEGHTAPFVEGTAFSENPAAGQALTRKFTSGVIQDTGNNANDFTLQ